MPGIYNAAPFQQLFFGNLASSNGMTVPELLNDPTMSNTVSDYQNTHTEEDDSILGSIPGVAQAAISGWGPALAIAGGANIYTSLIADTPYALASSGAISGSTGELTAGLTSQGVSDTAGWGTQGLANAGGVAAPTATGTSAAESGGLSGMFSGQGLTNAAISGTTSAGVGAALSGPSIGGAAVGSPPISTGSFNTGSSGVGLNTDNFGAGLSSGNYMNGGTGLTSPGVTNQGSTNNALGTLGSSIVNGATSAGVGQALNNTVGGQDPSAAGQFPWQQVLGGLAQAGGSALYGSQIADAMKYAVDKADPFASQRPFYQGQLQQMYTDPNYFNNSAILQGANRNAVNDTTRAMSAQGYNMSGNVPMEVGQRLQNNNMQYAQNLMNQTGGYAGAGFGPGQAGVIAGNMGGQAAQANTGGILGGLGTAANGLAKYTGYSL